MHYSNLPIVLYALCSLDTKRRPSQDKKSYALITLKNRNVMISPVQKALTKTICRHFSYFDDLKKCIPQFIIWAYFMVCVCIC
jgi:hypothetical protein